MKERIYRFSQYMEYKGLNDNQVTKDCGLGVGVIGGAKKGKSDLGAKTIKAILEKYQDLNKVWLLTGEGEMIKASRDLEALTQKDETHTIRYWVDVSATGGNVQFLENPNENNVRWISVPNFSECTDAVNLYGDSMSPVYKNGEVIILKEWTENYIEYGNVYLVVTNNGNRTVKYLQPGSDDAHVRCVSANPHYAPFEIELSAIKRIYIVKGRIAKDVM